MTQWGTIYGPEGRIRRFIDSDVEWAVKMIVHEAGRDPINRPEWDACLWTTTNRWISGKYLGGRGDLPYGTWLRTFSQPINPTQIGVIHEYDRTPEDPSGQIRSAARDARITGNLNRPLSFYVENHPEAVQEVLRFFKGYIPVGPYVGLVDFSQSGISPGGNDIGPIPVPGVYGAGIESNWFYKEPFSVDWTAETVRIVPPEGVASPRRAILAAIGIGAIAAGVGVYVYHRRHHELR